MIRLNAFFKIRESLNFGFLFPDAGKLRLPLWLCPFLSRLTVQLLTILTDKGADLIHIVKVAAIQSAPHRSFA